MIITIGGTVNDDIRGEIGMVASIYKVLLPTRYLLTQVPLSKSQSTADLFFREFSRTRALLLAAKPVSVII